MRLRSSLLLLPRLAAAASLCTLSACSGDGIMVPGDGSIARLAVVAGDGQRAIAGQTLPQPLVVRALDQSGRPVTGAAITFRFINTDGRVAPGTASTGGDGQATAQVTLGGSVGAQVVEARAVDPDALAVEFQLTALKQQTHAPPDPGAGDGGSGNGDTGNGSGGGGNANGGSGQGSEGGSVGGGGGSGSDIGGGSGGGSAGGDEGSGGNGGAAGGSGGSGGSGGGGDAGGGGAGNGNNGKGKGHHEHGHNRHGRGHGGKGHDSAVAGPV